MKFLFDCVYKDIIGEKIMKKKILVGIVALLCVVLAAVGIAFNKGDIVTNNKKNCTIIVSCENVLNNMDKLNEQKRSIIPSNGIILSKKDVQFNDGEMAFDVLKNTLKREKIHMEFEETPGLNSVYIEGINNLYEFDCGNESGWSYVINDKGVDVGCSEYMVKDDDVIKFYYVCSWDDFVF